MTKAHKLSISDGDGVGCSTQNFDLQTIEDYLHHFMATLYQNTSLFLSTEQPKKVIHTVPFILQTNHFFSFGPCESMQKASHDVF